MMKLKMLLIIFFLGIQQSSYSIHGNSSLVLNGLDSSAIVAIFMQVENKKKKIICSGSLISTDTILTAAHCFDGVDFTNTNFFIQSNTGEESKVSQVKISKNYKREDIYDPDWGYLYEVKLFNDIALIKIEKEFENSEVIKMANKYPVKGDAVFFSGYGQTARIFGIGEGEGTLRFSKSLLIDEIDIDTARVSDGSSGLCLGDSGGPTLVKTGFEFKIIGINSMSDCMVDSKIQLITNELLSSIEFLNYEL